MTSVRLPQVLPAEEGDAPRPGAAAGEEGVRGIPPARKNLTKRNPGWVGMKEKEEEEPRITPISQIRKKK
jgi:hypothetical protein